MDVDMDEPTQLAAEVKASKKDKGATTTTTTAPSSNASSPKPSRPAKEAPPPLPQGSGLISNALFGTDDTRSSGSSRTTPNIVLHIPLQRDGNQIINFARMAEEQYGFAALHPRLAAHKERLARVAAAGAALERNEKGGKGLSAGESADEDLSLNVDRDSDLDGDVAMGGVGANSAAATNGTTPTDAPDGKKKRRKKKMEEYDRDDPFVDDSELAWQEHAAASKDGFFVYSGPLVPEGEKVQVERADGTIKRGRGRGRGGRSRGGPSTHQVPIAAAVPISQETGLPLRGPGSRGGSTTRRPRPSKSRQQAEQDKQGASSTTTSQGRGGGAAGRGGGAAGTRGAKTPSVVELAPAPRPSLAPAPAGPSPLAGPEVASK
ncbi:uncharacterized protein CDV56_107497 [Aspergillus thermomutatus]|uniref:Hpc2-related domain-containing protein n=1 Tax=Aspergillus thermomutatus TaxID=41047 RepID=A0A397GNB9_ASPTH|nr:uncharacterized protein CDV56_107497 [Aspergillus thermomutatus]RHZ52531.1 hypothetical protein CDV56_107497 [Aspergillus thermomutatus]